MLGPLNEELMSIFARLLARTESGDSLPDAALLRADIVDKLKKVMAEYG